MKVQSPLMSLEARGLIGERLVFSKRSSGQQARFQLAQKSKNSVLQIDQKNSYSVAVSEWNSLSLLEKQVYIDNARDKHYTGYNAYLKQNIISLLDSFYGVVLYGGGLYGSN